MQGWPSLDRELGKMGQWDVLWVELEPCPTARETAGYTREVEVERESREGEVAGVVEAVCYVTEDFEGEAAEKRGKR